MDDGSSIADDTKGSNLWTSHALTFKDVIIEGTDIHYQNTLVF